MVAAEACQESGGPVLALEGFGQRSAASGRGLVDAAARTGGRRRVRAGANQSEAGEFLDRVVDLRPGDAGPVAHLTPFQFEVRLVAVHRALGQQA